MATKKIATTAATAAPSVAKTVKKTAATAALVSAMAAAPKATTAAKKAPVQAVPAKKPAKPQLLNVYIAFSIAGSNCFITASKTGQTPEELAAILLDKDFEQVVSRRTDVKPTDVKLKWAKLNKKDGTPTISRTLALQRFAELAKAGWTVDKSAFVAKHF